MPVPADLIKIIGQHPQGKITSLNKSSFCVSLMFSPWFTKWRKAKTYWPLIYIKIVSSIPTHKKSNKYILEGEKKKLAFYIFDEGNLQILYCTPHTHTHTHTNLYIYIYKCFLHKAFFYMESNIQPIFPNPIRSFKMNSILFPAIVILFIYSFYNWKKETKRINY